MSRLGVQGGGLGRVPVFVVPRRRVSTLIRPSFSLPWVSGASEVGDRPSLLPFASELDPFRFVFSISVSVSSFLALFIIFAAALVRAAYFRVFCILGRAIDSGEDLLAKQSRRR